MAFSKPFLEEVKRRNHITDVISRFVPLKRAGSNMVGCCPFHSEKTPSFTVFSGTESYYCFGCGAGGDVITFVMQSEGLEYREAVEQLAKMAGIPMEEDPYERKADQGPQVKKDRLFALNKAAARFFYAKLQSPEGAYAREYLQKRRFSDTTVRRFGIGFAPDKWDSLCYHLRKEGYTDEEITVAFLGRKGKNGKMYDLFRNRLMFPIFDLTGEVVAFSGRRLNEEDERKYVNTSDTPVFKKSRILFGLNFAKNESENGLILCEGAPDCIAMHQAGFGNAIATLGTAITGEHARTLSRFTKMVYLAYDIDKAGRKATMRGIELLNQVGVDTKIIHLGEGDSKDPDEFIKNHGAEAFRAKLSGSQGQIDYRIGEILSRFDLSVPDEKLRCSHEMAEYVATIGNRLEREIYASRAAEKLGLSPESLRNEAESKRRTMEKNAKKQEHSKITRDATGYGDQVNTDKLRFSSEAPHEEAVLGILLLHPELGKELAPLLEPEDFATSFNRKLWELFRTDFAAGIDPELTADGSLSPREIGAAEGYRAARATLGSNDGDTLRSHIDTLKDLRSRREYDGRVKEDPGALREYLALLRKQNQNKNSE
ncbi:MAG: DNA primase [Clostridia bacterium]|nr:DNA primase [Clostridia bacterium]